MTFSKISDQAKLKIAGALALAGSIGSFIVCKAAELDATTSEAIGAFGTDAAGSLTTWITANGGKFVSGIIAISLMFLGFRLVRKVFGGR